ncbi:ribose-5-phosphate isomerase RpiA [Bacillus solitudinis]|uniref:ribose-5-phosphate isomerase RpiA n=1 Tax=Bacillus solitudinis TaxID=2014074 RepID=UPI000C230B37|nr:ribose-5-phosphate isomerase RpiA [Bacillus solitudinis]
MLNEIEQSKKCAGEKAVEMIEDGMTVGLGSGSTMYWVIKRIGQRVKEGLKIKGVPSSIRTEGWAKEFGVPLTDFSQVKQLDIAIDGADEVDPNFNLIKGGGGSLVREKIVAAASKKLIIVVDESKRVEKLGSFGVPVEIVPFGWETTARRLAKLGYNPIIRKKEKERFVSNNGNYIVDCQIGLFEDAATLQEELKKITGVVETGLFIKMTDMLVVGGSERVEILTNK